MAESKSIGPAFCFNARSEKYSHFCTVLGQIYDAMRTEYGLCPSTPKA